MRKILCFTIMAAFLVCSMSLEAGCPCKKRKKTETTNKDKENETEKNSDNSGGKTERK